MRFNEIIKQLRFEKRLNQKDIASAIGIDRTTYTKYETGKSQPDFSTVQKLAEFYSVSVDYLLGRTDIRNPHISDEYAKKHKVTKRDLVNTELQTLLDNAKSLTPEQLQKLTEFIKTIK